MPLVDHSQLQQQDEGLEDGVEVVAAVTQAIKCGVLQKRVATPQVLRGSEALVVTMVTYLPLEQLHANDGKEVVEYLGTNTSTFCLPLPTDQIIKCKQHYTYTTKHGEYSEFVCNKHLKSHKK